jgi:hypothetical protein
MSFAKSWLRYLEQKETIFDIVLIGDAPEKMPYTKIDMRDGEIYQYLEHRNGMKLPDKIKIKPVAVKGVKIRADKFVFQIREREDGKATMDIRYINAGGEGLESWKKQEIINKAKELGYEVKSFEITDV